MTPYEMDNELTEAQHYAPHFTLDRCRHESVTATALWLFDAEGRQVGACSRTDYGGWRASHMHQGMPLSQREHFHMVDALDYIATRHARFVKRNAA